MTYAISFYIESHDDQPTVCDHLKERPRRRLQADTFEEIVDVIRDAIVLMTTNGNPDNYRFYRTQLNAIRDVLEKYRDPQYFRERFFYRACNYRGATLVISAVSPRNT